MTSLMCCCCCSYAKGANISVCNPYGEGVDNPAGKKPIKGSCPRMQMHKLDTQFYLDLATPTGGLKVTTTCCLECYISAAVLA
jgi:hypothetical protein